MSQADRDDLLLAIEEEARRLARFVSNLLDMTRVEAGVTDLKRDWVDVADVLRGAVTRAEKTFPHRVHVIRFGADLPLVRGDAVMLEQAVFNLLDNADKYSGPGKSTAVRADEDRNGVSIAIEDEGCGIPKSISTASSISSRASTLGMAARRAAEPSRLYELLIGQDH